MFFFDENHPIKYHHFSFKYFLIINNRLSDIFVLDLYVSNYIIFKLYYSLDINYLSINNKLYLHYYMFKYISILKTIPSN